MSLKAFHVFFVTFATMLAVGFGVWCLRQAGGGYLPLALVSMLAAAMLVVYAVWFIKKTKGVSYL